MVILILKLMLPVFGAIAGLILAKSYFGWKYPTPTALGRVLPKLCVVDSDEIWRYNEGIEEECELNPDLAHASQKNQIRVNSSYLGQMRSNTLLFQQVVRFERLKIDFAKSSFEYEPREILVLNLIDESVALRSELFRATVDLRRRGLLGRMIDQKRLHDLLVKYKSLEHEMIELASMANDKTCRDMLIERLGLIRWKIIPGGGSEAEPA